MKRTFWQRINEPASTIKNWYKVAFFIVLFALFVLIGHIAENVNKFEGITHRAYFQFEVAKYRDQLRVLRCQINQLEYLLNEKYND